MMGGSVYRALLRLLPRARRQKDGAEMARVFADVRASTRIDRGRAGVALLWITEAIGVLKFAVHDRLAARRSTRHATGRPPWRWNWSSEMRWAWRGIAARRGRVTLMVALVAVALAANAIIFAAADSFLYHRAPYRDAGRLAVLKIGGQTGWRSGTSGRDIAAWRKTPFFSQVEGAMWSGSLFVMPDAKPSSNVTCELVTPGVFSLLGVHPQWGRLLLPSDPGYAVVQLKKDLKPQQTVAVIAEELARDLFGDPARAPGRLLPATDVQGDTVTIVGVMPAGFRFPTGAERIWEPLDPSLVDDRVRLDTIGRLAPGLSWADFTAGVERSAPAVAKASALGWEALRLRPFPMIDALADDRVRRSLQLLVAAAACLLIIACANIASLELTHALGRARQFAVQAALGASRGTIVRTALLEGGLAVGAGVAVAYGFAVLGTTWLVAQLPKATINALAHPIDIDGRALAAMGGAAGLTWLATSLPVALFAFRPQLMDVLKADRTTTRGGARSVRVRQVLVVAEVALTVLLSVGTLVSARAYGSLMALDKGFNSTDAWSVVVRQPPRPAQTDAALQADLLDRLRAAPFVRAVTPVGAVPPEVGGGYSGRLFVEGQPQGDVVELGLFPVEPDYFDLAGVRILAGRAPRAGDGGRDVVVDEAFARKYLPGAPVGVHLQMGSATSPQAFTVIGVASHVRTRYDTDQGLAVPVYPTYMALGTHTSLEFFVRLATPAAAGALSDLVRAAAPHALLQIDAIDTLYGRVFADSRLAAAVMRGFGVLALAVAIAGVYGVAMYLVVSRRREIGIRITLGATRADVGRLVVGSALRLAVIGAAIGLAAALAVARWQSALFAGTRPAGAVSYLGVTAIVLASAALATWQPARRAAGIDPAVTLRES
jgi:putative ABC transport system permease protein